MSLDPQDFMPDPDSKLIRCPRDLGDGLPDHELNLGNPQQVQDVGGGGPTGEFVYNVICLACELSFVVPAVYRPAPG